MTKIKLCGLKRKEDIDYVNILMPEYIGFVFAEKSTRYVTPEKAKKLSEGLNKAIIPIGVFVNAEIGFVSELVNENIIRAVQLHGSESEEYISLLRQKVNCTVIQAFKIRKPEDVIRAEKSSADLVLLDSDGGSGKTFNHSLLDNISRPYFLAGGLNTDNVREAIKKYAPYGVDVSSAIESNGFKDIKKMTAFVEAVRN